MLHTSPARNLSEVFNDLFEVRLAESERDRDISFRLRYQVYCLEQGFEDSSEFPNERETDVFDRASHHALLCYRPTGSVVGTVRLVLAAGLDSLPLDNLHSRPRDYMQDVEDCEGRKLAEISRFCVARSMRRRDGEDRHADIKWPYNTEKAELRRQMPNLSLGLMCAVVLMAREQGVTHLCAAMEHALLVLLKRLGIVFHPLGPRVDYRGVRQPCHRSLEEISTEMWVKNLDVWNIVFGEENDAGRGVVAAEQQDSAARLDRASHIYERAS